MAAAYAALLSLFNNLENILTHPHHSFSFEKKQIQSLLEIVTFLIEFLEGFDHSQGASKEAAQLLERRITRAAHAAEEVIESHVVNQIKAGSTVDGKRRSRFFLDVQKVIEDMDFVKRKAIKVPKVRIQLKRKQPMYSATSSTPVTSQKNITVGYDDVLRGLLDLLTGEPSSRQVISIVGTGGIGKTTLARNAFEHSHVANRFDVFLWGTISQQYVVEEILLQLLCRKEKRNSETIVELGEQLHQGLFGRRYLIVLDDMWSIEAWEDIKFFSPDTSNGSRIVVTSRQSRLSDHIGSSCITVDYLDKKKSWDLFCEKAFGSQGCPNELEDVGKRIVEKCRGLPLAIVVVAGHLSKSSRMQEYWENVANNMNSVLNSEENKHFLDILSFSYSNLPVHLKPCFSYMGTYREDARIEVPNLIKRWIAEGILKPCKGKNLEEIARDHLRDLIDRNLIFHIKIPDGVILVRRIELVGIHDMLRELCIKVAEKEKFFYVVDKRRAICRERPRSGPLVRCLRWEKGDEQSLDLKFLRVLYKNDHQKNEIDEGSLEADLQLVNLRSIEYSGPYRNDCFFYLCSPLSMLWNLQSLYIQLAGKAIIAPQEIWEMPQLRNLRVGDAIRLPLPLPCDSPDHVMQNLQTLERVENFELSEEVCRRIPNIKELVLIYSDTAENGLPQSSSYYCLHNISCFHKLESLTCEFNLSPKTQRKFGLSLAFPNSLKNLSLWGSKLDWEEMTEMVGSLPCLETLELSSGAAIGSEWTLVEGKFPRLKFLWIICCDDLINWKVGISCFPVLEKLVLEYVLRLEEFPWGIGEIPTLESILLSNCSEALMMSAVRVVKQREEEQGSDDLRLDLVFDMYSGRETVEIFNKKVEEAGLTITNLHQRYWEETGANRTSRTFCARDFT